MEFAAFFFAAICYGLAAYLWWRDQTPIYFVALLSGHLSALASPLWQLLYNFSYSPSLATVQAIFDQTLPLSLIIAAAWFYPLPALLVIFLYFTRWWFPGYLTGLLTYLVFLLYHLLIEALGLRSSIWSYTIGQLPFGMPAFLLSAIMSGLTSFGLLYVLLITYRYALGSLAIAVLPATLLISLGVHGLLGAPLWVTLLLRGESWMIGLGTLSALALLAWAVHIVTSGLQKVEG